MIYNVDITTFFLDRDMGQEVSSLLGPIEQVLDELNVDTVRVSVFSDYRYLSQVPSNKDIYLDIHLSDTWADPSHQEIPKSWDFMNLSGLRSCYIDYISTLIDYIKSLSLKVKYIQVGNEITNGFLWPYLYSPQEYVRFLKIAHFLLRDAFPDAKLIVHTDLSYSPEKAVNWYSQILDYQLDYDFIGLSYYPVWHGTLSTLRDTITSLNSIIQKQILLCEVGYMNTSRKTSAWFGNWQCDNIPYSPQGQARYIKHFYDFSMTLQECLVPELYYWGAFSFKSNEHYPMSLWSKRGKPLPALLAIKEINLKVGNNTFVG